MMNGQKEHPPPPDQLAVVDVQVAAPEEEERPDMRAMGHWRSDVARVVMRVMCMVASVTGLSFMVTAHQTSMASFYGFQLQLYSIWSLSDSFEYLVGISSAASAYSLLQLLVSGRRLLRNSPVIPSRNQAWLSFAIDQIFAYGLMSAGSAALGVTNMNRTGIRHTALPDFCKSLNIFCDHVAVSVVFTLFGFVLLAASAVLDVIWLTK